MEKVLSGVYRITNTLNGKFYIGCSTNIKRRWSAHRTRYKQASNKEYNRPLYKAIREDGIENFNFDILELVDDREKLYSREYFFIKELHACQNGYNEDYGGENHGRAKLTADDVVDIRERYAEHESKRNVYLDYCYKIGERGFHKVWNGYTWPDIKMDVYTKENKDFHKHDTGSPGELNKRTALTNEEVFLIRKKKTEGERARKVYEPFKNKLTFGSFMNIWYGCNWKNIA